MFLQYLKQLLSNRVRRAIASILACYNNDVKGSGQMVMNMSEKLSHKPFYSISLSGAFIDSRGDGNADSTICWHLGS